MTYHVQFPGLGLEFTLDRVAFTVFGMPIYWYGILIATGLALAIVFAFSHARRFGIDSDRMVDVILIGTVCAVIGGRAFYVATAPFEYASFAEMLDIRLGGVAIYGAVIAAFLSGYFACRWRKVPILPMFDLAGMGFLLGQGIGRWGNFVNQEAFGTNTTLPWGMYSEGTCNYLSSVQETLAAQGVAVDPSLPVHPTFLYESIWCLLGFFLLWAYMKRRKFHGELILMYVMWYGAERFFVEGLRTDSLMVGSFRISQVIAAVSVIAALCIWLALRKKYKDKPLTVTYTALVKEDGRQVPYEFSWLSGETPPTDAEMKAEIERRRAARAAEETAQAEEKAPETEESGGASGVPEQREAEADTQAAPEEEQAAPAQEAAADAAEKDSSMRSRRNNSSKNGNGMRGNRRIKMAELISGKNTGSKTQGGGRGRGGGAAGKGRSCPAGRRYRGENPASRTYVAGRGEGLRRMRGLLSDVIALPEETTEPRLEKIMALNADKTVHGVLVQLPLPGHIREKRVIDAISPDKDVDGFTPVNVGRMVIGGVLSACTPAGCIEVLKSTGVPIAGKDAVVIGPQQHRGANPRRCCSRPTTPPSRCAIPKPGDLKAKCAAADIIVAAIGKAASSPPIW